MVKKEYSINNSDPTLRNRNDGGVENPVFIPDPDSGTDRTTHPREPPPDYETTITQNTTIKSLSADDGGKPKTIWTSSTDPESGKQKEAEGEVPTDGRDTWDSPLEFLLSCISLSVGLGNVWRFPFVAYANGGGAFLIPYLIVLMLIGRPMYYLEMCIGQFSRSGQVAIWNMSPFFRGVGYGTLMGTVCVVTYYVTIMGQTMFYFFASFQTNLPWTVCDQSWGGEDLCYANGTLNPDPEIHRNRSLADWYYRLEAFPQKPNIDDGLGSPEWRLTLCLLASWLIIFLSLWKGIKSSGKVAYFTAIFPYVVMIILLIRGVTLPGAGKGLRFFFEPKWEKLLEPGVWYQAVAQCFFSLNTAFGPIIMFSSYNPFRHNTYKDAMIISFMDTFTSILAGCTIFSVLGYLADRLGVDDIGAVTSGGPGLAFVSYPEALANFPVPQLFSVLFFLMVLTLGIGSAVSLTTGIITVITDKFKSANRLLVTLVVCLIGFLAGLLYITPGGGFMVDLVDEFGANFVIYVLAMVELMGIAWAYGVKNVEADIQFMLNRSVSIYWKFCWVFATPVGLLGILVYKMVTYEEFKSGNVSYPTIAITCGWLLSAACLSCVPIFGLHAILTRKASTLKEKILEAFRPTKKWGPSDPKLRKEWIEYRESIGLEPLN